MPRFEVQGPDGGRYEVEAPDEKSALAVFDNSPATPAEKPSTASDVARSAASGVGQGAIGMAGLVPDAANALRKGADWLIFDRIFGKRPEMTNSITGGNLSDLGTSASLKKSAEGLLGKFYEPQTTAGQYAKTVGEFVPASMLGPGGIAPKLATAATAGLASEGAGQLTKGTSAEPWARLAGGLAGAFAPGLLSKAVTPLPIDAQRAKAVATLQNEGIPLTAGQKTGSKPLQWAESALSDVPLAGGKAKAIQEAQGEALTAAALKRAGTTANRATPEVLEETYKRIGGDFDRLAAGANARIDQQFANDLGKITTDYVHLTPKGTRAPIADHIVNSLIDHAKNSGGVITGEQYKTLRSLIGRNLKSTRDPELTGFLKGVQNSIDDLMMRSAGPDTAAAWKNARSQYRNYIAIENAAGRAGENAAMGLISPSALRGAVKNQGARSYAHGGGDLSEIARAAEGVMKPLPNSGTAPRNLVTFLTGGGAMSGSPATAAAMIAGPAISGRVLMSRPVQAYLANQVMPKAAARFPSLAQPQGLGLLDQIIAKGLVTSPVSSGLLYGRNQ